MEDLRYIVVVGIYTLSILSPVIIFLISWFGGNWHQRKLRENLLVREKAMLRDNISTLRTPLGGRHITRSDLLAVSVVAAPSHFQLFLAKIKTIFGGNVKSLDKILDWGRLEAIQRLRELAIKNGFDDVLNMRMETSTIQADQTGKSKNASVEILAYGTGVSYQS